MTSNSSDRELPVIMGTRRKKFSAKKKIEIVAYAKGNSNRSDARKYAVHSKSVRVWRQNEDKLGSLDAKASRAGGAGRKTKVPHLEEKLLQQFREQREKKTP